jgi:hypothetical protein
MDENETLIINKVGAYLLSSPLYETQHGKPVYEKNKG